MKKKNLFIVCTAYQFISAYTICADDYASDDFENEIYFLKSDRTDYDLNYTKEDFNGQIIRFEQSNWIDVIKKLQNQFIHRFFFFQENSILNKYLAYRLKKNRSIICLGPDGTKPYGVFNKNHEFLSMIKDTLKDYKYLRKHKLKLPKLIWSKYYRYGSCVLLDEVWLQYSELFNASQNKTKAKIVKLPALNTKHIEKLIDIFNFKNTQLIETNNIILYFNQPFQSKELIDKENEILNSICKQYPNNKIYIKLHPSTNSKVLEGFKKNINLSLIDDNLPGELYLGLLRNCILITGWSAALMHDISNSNNKNYYLLPMYKKVNDKTLAQISLVAFAHIEMVESVTQIKFKN